MSFSELAFERLTPPPIIKTKLSILLLNLNVARSINTESFRFMTQSHIGEKRRVPGEFRPGEFRQAGGRGQGRQKSGGQGGE